MWIDLYFILLHTLNYYIPIVYLQLFRSSHEIPYVNWLKESYRYIVLLNNYKKRKAG